MRVERRADPFLPGAGVQFLGYLRELPQPVALIVRDAQGLTGKKVEVYSLPYSRINMWSSENAGGMFDFNSELEMWTRAGHIKIKLDKKVDVRRLDQLIAWAVLRPIVVDERELAEDKAVAEQESHPTAH